jgi:hypothetical protein
MKSERRHPLPPDHSSIPPSVEAIIDIGERVRSFDEDVALVGLSEQAECAARLLAQSNQCVDDPPSRAGIVPARPHCRKGPSPF